MHEEVILQANPSERGSKYDTPEIISYVVEKKNEGMSFAQITENLKQRGYESISPNKVSELHKRATARSVVYHNTASEEFEDYSGALKECYGEAIKILGEYVRNFRDINDRLKKLNADGDMDILKMKMEIAQQVPQAVKILKEIREFTKFQADLQDKMITEQKKEVWSETQMMDYVTKYLPTLLKEYERENKIKILDRSVLK